MVKEKIRRRPSRTIKFNLDELLPEKLKDELIINTNLINKVDFKREFLNYKTGFKYKKIDFDINFKFDERNSCYYFKKLAEQLQKLEYKKARFFSLEIKYRKTNDEKIREVVEMKLIKN